jgi:biopolymer transport protein ExbD
MRIKKVAPGIVEGDLTPMIDMTFQLIAFFTVLINFSQSEQVEEVVLPASQLAKPPDAPLDFPITLNLTTESKVIIGGQEIPMEALRPFLVKEKQVLESEGRPLSEATIVIRAHKNAPTGKVQELVRRCQEDGFEKFALRAKEDLSED